MCSSPFNNYIRLSALFLVLSAVPSSPAFAEQIEVRKSNTQFSMEFRNAEIKDVLRAVGQAANLNMIISDTVAGQVSLSLKDVDLLEALEAILKTKGLTYVREGNIMRVVAVSEARDEDLETRVFPLGYASGKDVLSVVEKIKSDHAKVSADSRMNALVVKDLSLNIDRMARLIKNLDMRTPQVMIEAKIVEVANNYARELGIQWGGQYAGTSGRGTTFSGGTTGVSGTSSSGSTSSSATVGPNPTLYPSTGDIGRSGNAYAVNLPASVGAGSGGAMGVSFGTLTGKLQLDLQLSAMVTTGNGKILSSPKVMTMNNREAKISSGTDIPIKIVSAGATGAGGSTTTAGIQTISASLSLSTIPTITSDNRIAMVIKVEKAEPDFSRQVDGVPTIIRRNASAEVVVNNGETVVLGGIYVKKESESESGIPLLSQIPLLGWLFKKKGVTNEQAELLIFITPTIVQGE
jgi:type IV pilus assembly protein PilQ